MALREKETERRNILLGVGDVYVDRVYVGQVKGVNVEITEEKVSFYAGRPRRRIKQDVIQQDAMITINQAELDVKNLKTALSEYGEDVGATFPEFNEGVTISGTDWNDLNHDNLSSANPPVVVKVSDQSTLVEGIDYDICYTLGQIRSTGTGDLADGDQVKVSYEYTDPTAEVVTFGGLGCDEQTYHLVEFVHDRPNCKKVMIQIYKARPQGALSLAFAEDDHTVYDQVFEAFADEDRPVTDQLCRVIIESQDVA